MAERRTEVKTFLIHLMCDKCEYGEMKPTASALLSHPPQYPHVCDKCGEKVNIHGGIYPRLTYEEAGYKEVTTIKDLPMTLV